LLGYFYTFTNLFNGRSITIGIDDMSVPVSQSGNGLLLQEYPNFPVEVRNEERSRLGQHGIWDFFSFYGKRNLTFAGVILANSHANLVQWERKLKEIFTLPAQPIVGVNDGYIQVSWTDAFGLGWKLDAKIIQDLTFSRNIGNQTRGRFIVALKASSSIIRSLEDKVISEEHGWRQNSLFIPAFLPAYFSITFNNLINIYQAGTSDAPAVFRLYGPLTDPRISQLKESFQDETQIDIFTEGWTGGQEDIDHYQLGSMSQRLTSTNGVQATMEKTFSSVDLTSARYITFYFYVDDVENMAFGSEDYTLGQNYIRMFENDGVDEFIAEFILGNNTIKNGWNYFRLLRDQFEIVGTPSWSNINGVEFSIKSKLGTTLNISFDDLKVRNITHSERKLEYSGTIVANDYVDFDFEAGTILNSSGSDVSSNLTSDSEWFALYIKQNLLLLESDADPALTGDYPYYYNDPVEETGLVGYWHFDEQTLEDYAGSNNGVAVGSVNYISTTVGESLYQIELDGSSYVEMNCPYDNFQVAQATVSCYITFDDFSADHVIFSRLFGEATYPYLEYDSGTDDLILHYSLDGSPYSLTLVSNVSGTYSIGVPYHLVLRFDPATGVESFFNLTDTASDSNVGTSYDAGTNTMKFGVNAGNTVYQRGALDELRLYNTLLTDDEITQLFYTPNQNKRLNQFQITLNDAII